jgi:hypothetical protein
MNYRSIFFILNNKDLFWSNSATAGSGDASTDAKTSSDPNDFLQPLAGNKFYLIIAIISVMALAAGFVILASKKAAQ